MPTSRTDLAGERGSLLTVPLAVGAVGAGLLAALHFHDPHQSGAWGYCPFLLLTGQPCPGCGGLRAMNDLSDGHVGAAISSNVMAVVLFVVLGVLWVRWVARRAMGSRVGIIDAAAERSWLLPTAIGLGFLAMEIARFTPWGAWLKP